MACTVYKFPSAHASGLHSADQRMEFHPTPFNFYMGGQYGPIFQAWPVLKECALNMVRLDLVSQAWGVINTWLILRMLQGETQLSTQLPLLSWQVFLARNGVSRANYGTITVIMVGRQHRFISRRLSYCTMFGVLDLFWPPIVPCYSTEDAVRIVNSFISIPITRNYNHSELFLTLLRVYTIIILIRSWLQSLIPLLHVYPVYEHYTLIFTALLHIKSPLHTAKLSPRSHSANSLLKTPS
jgi:hypothetical protein